MRLLDHIGYLLGDYPNAIRMRGLGLPARVPAAYAAGSERPVVLIPSVYEQWQFLRPIADALAALAKPRSTGSVKVGRSFGRALSLLLAGRAKRPALLPGMFRSSSRRLAKPPPAERE